jgi:hypothetical protein
MAAAISSMAAGSSPPSLANLSTVRAIASSRSLAGLIWINGQADFARDCIRNNSEHPSAGSPEECAGPCDRIPDILHAAGCGRQDSTRSASWRTCRCRRILKPRKKAPLGTHLSRKRSQIPVRRLLVFISAEPSETRKADRKAAVPSREAQLHWSAPRLTPSGCLNLMTHSVPALKHRRASGGSHF